MCRNSNVLCETAISLFMAIRVSLDILLLFCRLASLSEFIFSLVLCRCGLSCSVARVTVFISALCLFMYRHTAPWSSQRSAQFSVLCEDRASLQGQASSTLLSHFH